jgi:hypothetical protein
MISHCLNPDCRLPFDHDREGRFFSVDPDLELRDSAEPRHQLEQYWLCGTCAQTHKVVIEHGRISTVLIDADLAIPLR